MMHPAMDILTKNLLILASAGSGKTFQLGNRVIGLVVKGVPPEKIVALTFTRKAAGEFADSVLTKLADAVTGEKAAAVLSGDLNLPDADFSTALARVVRALPKFTLGTMDSFFAKIVRGFQYELGLTGGKFDLLEGPQAVAAADEILAAILGETLDETSGDGFFHAFRRATIGKEDQGVAEGLRGFVRSWQYRFRSAAGLEWGPAGLAGVGFDEWEKQKHQMAATVGRGLDGIAYSRKGQREALEGVLDKLTAHGVGSGSLNGATGLMANVLEAAAGTSGPMSVKFYKEFIIDGPAGDALRDIVRLAARCEMAAALHRTRAVREIIAAYDGRCERLLRRRGLLGFDDIKALMGGWAASEDARLRREAVDFRLDARHEHWLLDEFQDTSRADWLGLLPLVDEATSAEEGSMFIVGDRKQAIYAWRGGDVGLFDEITGRYGSGLDTRPMTESWRSCPEVLSLVNRVCGDSTTMRELFDDDAGPWEWLDHVPAAPLAGPGKRGEARVEVVDGKWEERLERLESILRELGIGGRPVSCGILVRGNAMVRTIADHLRAAGFDVIEEGVREPAKDNPVGLALGHLLNWLANPADTFAREVVGMSPLYGVIRAKHGESWFQQWESLLAVASTSGFAGMVEELVRELQAEWSDFGRRRAGDIIAGLANFDARGGTTPREAAEWIDRLEISQNPGVAAVQVMTIHKSKGLGFDVVILPDIPNDAIPSAQHFTVAEGDGWITQTPPKWARDLIPEMREAERKWSARQRYESFCLLYVALTRAKRGLYVLLEPPSASQEADKPSLANWMTRSSGAENGLGVIYQSGSPDWIETLVSRPLPESSSEAPALAGSSPRRMKTSPSGGDVSAFRRGSGGLGFGNDVHLVFERIGWLEDGPPDLPDTAAGKLVSGLLEEREIRDLFEHGGKSVELLREQAVDAVNEGKWISGKIDRLHLYRDARGMVTKVKVIDFKTDDVTDPGEFVERHASQMEAYRNALSMVYPGAEIDCVLLSTKIRGKVML